MTVFDIRQDAGSSKHGGKRWIDVFRSFVESLSGRSPSSWAPGTIEAQVVVEVDFGGGGRNYGRHPRNSTNASTSSGEGCSSGTPVRSGVEVRRELGCACVQRASLLLAGESNGGSEWQGTES